MCRVLRVVRINNCPTSLPGMPAQSFSSSRTPTSRRSITLLCLAARHDPLQPPHKSGLVHIYRHFRSPGLSSSDLCVIFMRFSNDPEGCLPPALLYVGQLITTHYSLVHLH